MNTAEEALKIAVIAQTQIASHEKICGERWKVVVRTNFVMVLALLTVLGMLLGDKFL
jgi:hypothetical protein